jgi:hypothetical protein
MSAYEEPDQHDDPERENELPARAGQNAHEQAKRWGWRFARLHYGDSLVRSTSGWIVAATSVSIITTRTPFGMAMLLPLLLLACFLFLDRMGSFRHSFEPSLRYRIAAQIGQSVRSFVDLL